MRRNWDWRCRVHLGRAFWTLASLISLLIAASPVVALAHHPSASVAPPPSQTAQQLELSQLVVPVSDLGPNWSVVTASGAGDTQLLDVYVASYANESDYSAPRVAGLTLMATQIVPAGLVMEGMGTAAIATGAPLLPYAGLGDGMALTGTVPNDAGGEARVYFFWVGSVVAVVAVGSVPAMDAKGLPIASQDPLVTAELDAQALQLALLQEQRLRNGLSIGEPLTLGDPAASGDS
jgi:hypothetical protein